MAIFSQIQSAVNSILPQLYADEDMVTVVTWKRFLDSQFDDDKGVNVDTYTDFPNLRAIKVEKKIGTKPFNQANTGGVWTLTSGDVVYLFQHEYVPVETSARDLIVDGSITYSVKKVFPVFGLIVKVEVEGYA